jgi:hypothetical protein
MLDCHRMGQVAARSPRGDVDLEMCAELAFAEQTGASFEAFPKLLPASRVPSALLSLPASPEPARPVARVKP